MSVLDMPRVAALPFGPGLPWYAGQSIVDGGVHWFPDAELPDAGWRWAAGDAVKRDDIALVTLDALAATELLYASEIPLTDDTTDEQLRTAVLTQLERCHCDLRECAGPIGFEYGEHPDLVQPRLAVCASYAARIVRTEATA